MKTNQRKNKKRTETSVHRGSTNIFSDLGFASAEAAELQVKAELTRQIYNRIKSLELTQMQAAKRLGVSQPDVSKLMNARFTGYSTDRLIALLNALAVDVEIVLRARNSTKPQLGIVRVRQAANAA
ncbi:MAG TPA: helix-turn-helix transcriptional regulator [Tepidisphaeraceae bacterium]|jgi:predicted XRE-type DNA-binding protein|nr:helix-turn-helix transcriptional regulator [Tepidisphaeraceae bacterium]